MRTYNIEDTAQKHKTIHDHIYVPGDDGGTKTKLFVLDGVEKARQELSEDLDKPGLKNSLDEKIEIAVDSEMRDEIAKLINDNKHVKKSLMDRGYGTTPDEVIRNIYEKKCETAMGEDRSTLQIDKEEDPNIKKVAEIVSQGLAIKMTGVPRSHKLTERGVENVNGTDKNDYISIAWPNATADIEKYKKGVITTMRTMLSANKSGGPLIVVAPKAFLPDRINKTAHDAYRNAWIEAVNEACPKPLVGQGSWDQKIYIIGNKEIVKEISQKKHVKGNIVAAPGWDAHELAKDLEEGTPSKPTIMIASDPFCRPGNGGTKKRKQGKQLRGTSAVEERIALEAKRTALITNPKKNYAILNDIEVASAVHDVKEYLRRSLGPDYNIGTPKSLPKLTGILQKEYEKCAKLKIAYKSTIEDSDYENSPSALQKWRAQDVRLRAIVKVVEQEGRKEELLEELSEDVLIYLQSEAVTTMMTEEKAKRPHLVPRSHAIKETIEATLVKPLAGMLWPTRKSSMDLVDVRAELETQAKACKDQMYNAIARHKNCDDKNDEAKKNSDRSI